MPSLKNLDCEATCQNTRLAPYSDMEEKHDASYRVCECHAHQPHGRSLHSRCRNRFLYGSAGFILVLLTLGACRYFAPTLHAGPSSLPSTMSAVNPSTLATWGLGGYLGPNCDGDNPINEGGSAAPSSCFNSTEIIRSVQFGSVPPGSFKYCTFTDTLCTQGAVLVVHPNLQCNQLDPFDPSAHSLKVVSASCTET